MKRMLFCAALMLTLCLPCLGDEGMWLLPMIEKMNAGAMRDLGCRLSPDQIYSINHSSLKDAVVHFGGGCTGEIISDEGLLVTNHHCGYSSIQKLSTPEHNYLEDGFWAMKRDEELPVQGLTVRFLENMTDVTDLLKDDAEGSKRKEILDAARETYPHCRVSIVDFYNSNIFYLIVYKVYKDVRLVGAPPASMGKFGGETDNWMWPRQTCDFSMFRVYAGKDNEPADYSPENQPLRPRRSLQISLKGYKENDFAMIMGFPGRTQRYMTASQLGQMLDVNDISIAARTVRQDIMWKAMRSNDAIGLQYANKYASSANGWKKWIGEKKAFRKLGVIEREKAKEAAFNQWVASDPERTAVYGGVIEKIDSLAAAQEHATEAMILLGETVARCEIFNFASEFLYMKTAEDSAAAFRQAKQRVLKQYKDHHGEVDRDITMALMKHYRENAAPEDYIQIPGWDFATMDIGEYVNNLFSVSNLTYSTKCENFLLSPSDVLSDPAYELVVAVLKKFNDFSLERRESAELLKKCSSVYTAGLMEWNRGKAMYPDANSTMRLTYGSVKPYSPQDGMHYDYMTTLAGVLEKEDPGNYEFRVPERLKEIYYARDYGQYALKDGRMPACFLVNCDITGGNSGSPVLDAKGRLIGLAFDGNWESMSSDVLFEPGLQRCICVDIRYVLLMMDKLGGAGYLLDEMNIVK